MSRVQALSYPIEPQGYTKLSEGFSTLAKSFFRNVTNSECVPYKDEIVASKRVGIESDIQRLVSIIDGLKSWPENWDGYGSAKPKASSIKATQRFLTNVYYEAARIGYQFGMPSITADEEGDVACEWWCKDRKLSIDISRTSIDYRQITDLDSSPRITFGELGKNVNEAVALLAWLSGGA